jgi:phosphoribosylpyrophosphate synthetase
MDTASYNPVSPLERIDSFTRIYSLLLQDDMVDDVQSFVAAAEVLKERGAYKIYVLATHGLLSSDAPRLIEDSPIDEASLQA